MAQPSRKAVLTLSSGGAAPESADKPTRIAAIDIGSNSIRQIIADVSRNGSIRVIDELKAAPRLGAGVERTGRLSEVAMQNALATLGRMAALAKQLGAKRTEVIATSAVRAASNGQLFLDLVREETGLRVKIVNGEDEAALSFRSALAHFDLGVGRAAILDIGGGSLELALSADGLVERLISLPLGAIRMTEEFLAGGRRKGLKRLRKHVRRELAEHLSSRHWGGGKIICSGGTATNLASIYLARMGMESARTIHGTVVSRVDLEHIVEILYSMSASERQGVPGLTPARADIIVAGLAVVAEVVGRLEARELVVSAYGIREGVLLEAARVTPTVADPGEARERSVLQLAERSHYEAPHSKHVQELALQLFDSLGSRLGCRPADRKLLADAALLHDIGYHINYDKHHKHSYHLVQHAELLGMTPADQIIVANVARYHRGSEPKRRHINFGSLDKEMRDTIVRLSAILRVADGFDRGHAGAVERIKVMWTRRALRLTAVPNRRAGSIRLDLWGAAGKSRLLSRVAGAPVEIVAPDGKVLSYEDEEGKPD
jgi:exopolyphosphatase/guanosine-5'-triphosphate,3'-diphosphate pyrophosphatase